MTKQCNAKFQCLLAVRAVLCTSRTSHASAGLFACKLQRSLIKDVFRGLMQSRSAATLCTALLIVLIDAATAAVLAPNIPLWSEVIDLDGDSIRWGLLNSCTGRPCLKTWRRSGMAYPLQVPDHRAAARQGIRSARVVACLGEGMV
jgi:hypothetical protein